MKHLLYGVGVGLMYLAVWGGLHIWIGWFTTGQVRAAVIASVGTALAASFAFNRERCSRV